MKDQRGFTLIEMIIVASITSIMSIILAVFITNSLTNFTRQQTKTTLQSNTKIAVEVVARDIRAAKLIENNNSQPDSNSPGAPGNLYSWVSTSGSGATLVLAIPARTATDDLIFIDSLHNNLYADNVVYFLDSDNILYKRTIKNTSAAGNAAVTTCPPASAGPGCPSDAKVVEDVADLNIIYYDATNAVTATPADAFSAKITLTQTQIKGSHTYSSDYTTTVSMRNR